MSSFIVEGLAGKASLEGSVAIRGAKNSVLPIMAASLVVPGETILTNVPMIADVASMASLLEGVGAYVTCKDNQCSVRTQDARGSVLQSDVAKRLRASVLLTGAVLARTGKVVFPHPGGCVLGSRPIDLFLSGFTALGAVVTETEEITTIEAPQGMVGGELFFRVPSVTATETFMIAATLAKGPVTLKNCAMEPEVVVLAAYLKSRGADIEGEGTPTILIRPSHLEANSTPFIINPDRIETGSFLILGALLGKDITITNTNPAHCEALIDTLCAMGVSVHTTPTEIRVSRPDIIKSASIRTHEYPGFPTDLQAPISVLLTQAEGESSILETIFDGRLNYTQELVRMGADISVVNPHKALIKGPSLLKARDIDGPDIRAGLAFLLAAATASGTSKIGNAHLIDRGYEAIDEKLSALGLSIKRVA
ncbi:MAG: UDP-N-acetylglucosamine 1-carboxyvinyltransferase [Patescibacteria group bacterium]